MGNLFISGKNSKNHQNTSKKGVKLFDTPLFFVVKSLRCEKRGLKRKVTETTENLLPTHTKPRVLWPNCCFRRQGASTAKIQLNYLIKQMKICFIKSRSVKHTEVLSAHAIR